MTPASAAGPPDSAWIGCALAARMISSPWRQWTRAAIWLHIVPDGR